MSEQIGKYLTVDKCISKPGSKTCVWLVSGERDVTLGRIAWFGPFRRYSFYPEPGTVFERVCLSDIVRFLDSVKDVRVEAA